MADDKPEATDRRGPEEIEPGHKGGSGTAQGRSVTKDAVNSDKDRRDGETAGKAGGKSD